MPYKHPYTLGNTGLVQVIQQLRKAFPPTVTAETLKKLGIAPNNESYLINTLKFIGVIDNDGNKAKEATSIFSKHDNDEFAKAFSGLVQNAYSELFSLHGDESWTLETGKLISFFRGSDESSAEVGKRQASTFQALAALSGYAQIPTTKQATVKAVAKNDNNKNNAKPQEKKPQQALPAKKTEQKPPVHIEKKVRDLGLTVRIEINLPAVADQETYNMIFKSIRENLIDVE